MLDRSTYIGSHDIAAILPDGKGGFKLYETAYTTAYEVWAAKRGVGVPFKKTFATERGLALEPVILAEWWKTQKIYDRERYHLCAYSYYPFVEEYEGRGLKAANTMDGEHSPEGDDQGTYGIHLRSKTHPHCGASPDALVYDTQEHCFVAGVDAKSANVRGFEKYETRSEMGVPQNLMIQGYYFMAVSGLPVWHFAVLEMAWDTIHEFTLERADGCERYLTIAEHFWKTYIETGKEPPSTGTKFAAFKKIHENMHGIGDGEVEATEKDRELLAKILAEEAEIKARKAVADEAKKELLSSMGEAGAITGICKKDKRGALRLDRKGA
jgi:hypothetical protein